MAYEIIHLPKEVWKGTVIPISYTTSYYYDVVVNVRDESCKHRGFTVDIQKKAFDSPVVHSSDECDFPDKLYEDHWEKAYAWGIIEGGKLVAAIETCPEEWNNRLRITELWVADDYQKQGIGHALMELAKEQVRRERRRGIALETQSCNVNAVDFYLHEGFTLIGLDTASYTNEDLSRKEVRLELGWFPEKSKRLKANEVTIRQETENDWHAVELMTQHAFWNKHHLGCDEHYLVHVLRQDKDYLPELSRIAVKDGEVLGCIMYAKSTIIEEEQVHDVLTFGPLCVEPKWQGCGVGALLFEETAKLAKSAGYKGIVIFGEPDYYPRLGFKTCDHYGITTSEGKNFDAFMCYELSEDSLNDVQGRFQEAEVYHNLPRDKVEEFNQRFPELQKMSYPGQWD